MNETVKNEENISIVERILRKTQNPKIAAVLALDLILVGVDTVSEFLYTFLFVAFELLFIFLYCRLSTFGEKEIGKSN